jgi:hypothetical protein
MMVGWRRRCAARFVAQVVTLRHVGFVAQVVTLRHVGAASEFERGCNSPEEKDPIRSSTMGQLRLSLNNQYGDQMPSMWSENDMGRKSLPTLLLGAVPAHRSGEVGIRGL